MNRDKNIEASVADVLRVIEVYYDYSFRVENSRCNSLIISMIESLEKLMPLLSTSDRERLQPILMNILEAMGASDYVKIRDILYYELKAMMLKIEYSVKGDCNGYV